MLLKDLQIEIKESTIIYCENASSINIAMNPRVNPKTRHIAMYYHFIRKKKSNLEKLVFNIYQSWNK